MKKVEKVLVEKIDNSILKVLAEKDLATGLANQGQKDLITKMYFERLDIIPSFDMDVISYKQSQKIINILKQVTTVKQREYMLSQLEQVQKKNIKSYVKMKLFIVEHYYTKNNYDKLMTKIFNIIEEFQEPTDNQLRQLVSLVPVLQVAFEEYGINRMDFIKDNGGFDKVGFMQKCKKQLNSTQANQLIFDFSQVAKIQKANSITQEQRYHLQKLYAKLGEVRNILELAQIDKRTYNYIVTDLENRVRELEIADQRAYQQKSFARYATDFNFEGLRAKEKYAQQIKETVNFIHNLWASVGERVDEEVESHIPYIHRAENPSSELLKQVVDEINHEEELIKAIREKIVQAKKLGVFNVASMLSQPDHITELIFKSL